MTTLFRRFFVAAVLYVALASAVFAEGVRFDWGQAEQVFPGVKYVFAERMLEGREDLECPHFPLYAPGRPRRVRLFAVRVDSQAESLRFAVTGRAEGWGLPMPDHRGEEMGQYVVRTRRQTALEFFQEKDSEDRKMLVAVNASPWSPFKGGVDYPFADRLGLSIADGVLVSPPDGRRPSLVVREDGRLDMMVADADTDLEGIRFAVSGFAFCLEEGQPKGSDRVLHPRTGYGLCEEKRYLYFLVVDGRQLASQGATVREVGEWLKHFGAHSGINMDGGGSTTLVLRDWEDGSGKVMNRPSFGLRKNGNHFGVFADVPEEAKGGP